MTLNKNLTYYTHAGYFHADEVTGYAICTLAKVCDQFERLTDTTNIPKDGLIADIGREYDPALLQFDHHQDFLTRPDGYPYATAGLLWIKYGESVIKNIIDREVTAEEMLFILKRIDEKFIKGIDAHDADSKYIVKATCSAGEVNIYSLSNVISSLNGGDTNNALLQNYRFQYAVNLVSTLLESKIANAVAYYTDIGKIYSSEFIEDHRIVVVNETITNYKEIILENYATVRYYISPSNHPGNKYSMIALPVELGSRELKLSIERLGGFDGFIHQGKWIAGSNSVEELIELAKLNLERL